MKRQKGFTLIELLVVIAIIGILSAIVLASLSSARSKAQDAKVQSQLANMRAAAEIYFGSNGSKYGPATAVCTTDLFVATSSGMDALVSGTVSASSKVWCGASDTAWSVSAALISDPTQFWCVDSVGKSLLVGTKIASAVVCTP